jgi:hypothetical protein
MDFVMKRIRMWIREAQKHMDPDPDGDPDPQHWKKNTVQFAKDSRGKYKRKGQ